MSHYFLLLSINIMLIINFGALQYWLVKAFAAKEKRPEGTSMEQRACTNSDVAKAART